MKAILIFSIILISSEIAIAQQLNTAWYAGGAGSDYIEAVAIDQHNNIIVTGATSSDGIATAGALQPTKSSGNDFFISKYRGDGTLVWCTYYGGENDDYAFTIAVDRSDNVYAGGHTKSNNLASAGAYQTENRGGYDALLVKFDSSGNRLWATYLGGDKLDQILACTTDSLGNVFVGGYTESNSNIATTNSYQQTFGGGSGDAFFAKFDSSGVLQWSSYYGGTGQDRFHCLLIDHHQNLVMSGTTPSAASIATSGSFQTKKGGGLDAFLAKFTNNGSRIWATYYGKKGTERGRNCCVDDQDNIYFTGFSSSDSMMATQGAYQFYWAGSYDSSTSHVCDAFIAKFSPQGDRIWATYFGGTESESSHGIAWYKGLVVTGGITASSTMIATANAFQPQLEGTQDAYLTLLNDSGIMISSTYYGGAKTETLGSGYGADVHFTSDGNLILTFSTKSTDLPSLNSFHLPNSCPDGMIACFNMSSFKLSHQNQFVSNNDKIFIYPNPATNEFTMEVNADKNSEAELVIRNLSSIILKTEMISLIEGKNIISVDPDGLPKGFYVGEIIFKDGRKEVQAFEYD